jgi:hypothetical protein
MTPMRSWRRWGRATRTFSRRAFTHECRLASARRESHAIQPIGAAAVALLNASDVRSQPHVQPVMGRGQHGGHSLSDRQRPERENGTRCDRLAAGAGRNQVQDPATLFVLLGAQCASSPCLRTPTSPPLPKKEQNPCQEGDGARPAPEGKLAADQRASRMDPVRPRGRLAR